MNGSVPLQSEDSQRPQVLARLLEVIVTSLKMEVPADGLSAQTALFGSGGLGCDSLDAFQLVVALESCFDVQIGELELYECGSIGGLADLLSKRLREP